MSRFQKKHRLWRLGVPSAGLLCLLLISIMWIGCLEPMPDGRGAPSRGAQADTNQDFGQAILAIIRREAAIHPTHSKQRVQGIDQLNAKWDIPSTMNAIIPPDALKPAETFMRSLLGFYDDGTISGLTQEGAKVLTDLAESPSVLAALVLSNQRVGMSPPLKAGEGSFILRVLEFPKQRELLVQLANWWLAHDGLSSDGKFKATDEKAVIGDFLNTAARKLQKLLVSGKKESPSLLNDALLLQDDRLDLKVGQRCAVRVDTQGNPTRTAEGKKFEATGAKLPPPFPGAKYKRGLCGEALTLSGKRLYEIRELPKTVLGSLLRVGRELIVRDLPLRSGQIPFPFNVPIGLRPLLGALSPQGGYTKQNPILQALRAGTKLMKGPKLYEILQLFARITEKEEAQLAATLSLFDQLVDLSNKHKTQIRKGNKLFEDLLPFLQEIVATPGMLEDLLKALQTPGLSARLKQGMVRLMQYKKSRVSAADFAQFKQGNVQAIFSSKVDHGLPDRKGNLSYFQRLMHLMNDFNRLPYTSKIKALGGISIPFIEMRVKNMALMFLRSITGELSIWETIFVNGKPIEPGLLKTQFKNSLPSMGLSEKPTPEQLAVFVNRKLQFKGVPLLGPVKVTLTLDEIKCKEGFPVINHHGDTLLAGLASGLIANDGGALKPIALVFSKYGKLPRLLDLFALMHKHWGSSGNDEKTVSGQPTYPIPTTNLRSAESMMVDALQTTGLLERLESFGKVTLEMRLSDAAGAPKGISSMQRYLSFSIGAPGTALKNTNIQPLFDAFDAITKALEGSQNQRARNAWEGAIDSLFDLLLQVEGKGDQAKFKNRRAPIVITKILYFMAKEIKKKDLAGQWAPELSRMQTDVEDLLTDPIIPKTIDLLDSMVNDRVLLDLTTQALTHTLPDHTKKPQQFGEFLQLVGSMLSPVPENIAVPLGQYLGRFLEKRQPLLTQLMSFLKRSIPLDTNDQLTALMRRTVMTHDTQHTLRASFFPELMRTMYRIQPEATSSPTVNDYRSIFQNTARYLTDKKRGLEKLYEVIRSRNGKIAK